MGTLAKPLFSLEHTISMLLFLRKTGIHHIWLINLTTVLNVSKATATVNKLL